MPKKKEEMTPEERFLAEMEVEVYKGIRTPEEFMDIEEPIDEEDRERYGKMLDSLRISADIHEMGVKFGSELEEVKNLWKSGQKEAVFNLLNESPQKASSAWFALRELSVFRGFSPGAKAIATRIAKIAQTRPEYGWVIDLIRDNVGYDIRVIRYHFEKQKEEGSDGRSKQN